MTQSDIYAHDDGLMRDTVIPRPDSQRGVGTL